jgi:hypothetical protein
MPVGLWDHNHPGIFVDGDDDFLGKAKTALNTLNSRSVGKAMLSLISKRCQGIGATSSATKVLKVVISLAADIGSTAENPMSFVAGQAALSDTRTTRTLPGALVTLSVSLGGTGSEAKYMPDGAAAYAAAAGVPTPSFIALGHELVHSLHSLNGDYVRDYTTAGQMGMPRILPGPSWRKPGRSAWGGSPRSASVRTRSGRNTV